MSLEQKNKSQIACIPFGHQLKLLSLTQQQFSFVTETTVCTLHINIPFDEWLNKYDKDEAPVRTKKNIKVLYRGVSKDNPHKAIMIAQAVEGVIDR